MKRDIFNKYLIKTYPLLFKNYKDPKQSLMCFGAEIEEGWQQLVLDLCECMNQYIKNNPSQIHKDFEVVQIKEKFGGLRFYAQGYPDTFSGMIWFAEHLSYQTCERCGKRGTLRNDLPWVRTLCDKHYKAKKNEIKKNRR